MRITDKIEHTAISFAEVSVERKRQRKKWGEQTHSPEKWLTILLEEVGEVANALLEDDMEGFHKELIEVAAVAVAIAGGQKIK